MCALQCYSLFVLSLLGWLHAGQNFDLSGAKVGKTLYQDKIGTKLSRLHEVSEIGEISDPRPKSWISRLAGEEVMNTLRILL